MTHSRILSTFFICLFIAACDKQELATPEETRPPLDLSIDNIPVESQINNDDLFVNEKEPTKENSELFKTLSKNQAEPKINLSGKLFTDEEKLENKEYLDSVEGVQINVEGKFE